MGEYIDPSVLQDSKQNYEPASNDDQSGNNDSFRSDSFTNHDSLFAEYMPMFDNFVYGPNDSAVDLPGAEWPPSIKQEPSQPSTQFYEPSMPALDTARSSSADEPQYLVTALASPNPEPFADLVSDPSQTSSPESTDLLDAKPATTAEWEEPCVKSEHVSQSVPPFPERTRVFVVPDKYKTRAETQMKIQLVVDPFDGSYMRLPRKTLAKPKHFASEEDRDEAESKGALHMDCMLVCDAALDLPGQKDAAMRRAAGKEEVRRRDPKIPFADLDKDDPAHPANGGEVLICDGCKERERKRYDRKKKKTEDEDEFRSYEDQRVIMINDKEYKKFKDVVDATIPDHQLSNHQLSDRAKQVEFVMRICCYCRHQNEKVVRGYRVIFTFTDSDGVLVAQHLSNVFHITDDHKNKESPEQCPRPLTINQHPHYPMSNNVQYAPPHPSNIIIPQYQSFQENQCSLPMGHYSSQPPTPIGNNFQMPMSPMDAHFPHQQANSAPPPQQQLRYPAPHFSTATASSSTTTATYYARHQRGQSHLGTSTPLVSPTTSMHMPTPFTRNSSYDDFGGFSTRSHMSHQSQDNYYVSAPQSGVCTPANLSRPASPSWEQGPAPKKTTAPLHVHQFYENPDIPYGVPNAGNFPVSMGYDMGHMAANISVNMGANLPATFPVSTGAESTEANLTGLPEECDLSGGLYLRSR